MLIYGIRWPRTSPGMRSNSSKWLDIAGTRITSTLTQLRRRRENGKPKLTTTRKPYPKPSKKDRIAEKENTKRTLRAYRDSQYALAKQRDGGHCVFCFFQESALRQASEVHHVYSRGRAAGDWREHYTNLLCTCVRHHPPPIITPGGSATLGWVEGIKALANAFPINKEFTGGRKEEGS